MRGIFKNIVIYYLTLLAKLKLKTQFKGQIIAVGGCYGKSSAVKLITTLLSQEYTVLSTYSKGKGLNSESGIPFAILSITPVNFDFKSWLKYIKLATKNFITKKIDYDYIVLEMGVDKPNDMKHLTKHFTPDISILLNSNNTHSANFKELHESTFKSYEALISEENGYIFERAKKAIFYNLQDPEVIKQINRFKGTIKIGYPRKSKKSIIQFKPTISGTEIKYIYKNKIFTAHHPTPLLEEYINTLELLILLAEYLSIKEENLYNTISTFKLPPGRCSKFEGVKDTIIIDSTYNSSLVPTTSALKLLSQIAPKRKIAILGDMRELGDLSESEHNKLALVAAQTTDIVITIGPLMKKYFVRQFYKIKHPNQKIHEFQKTKEALEFIKENNYQILEPNDTILVKGSQNTLFLEIIVEELLKNKKDKKLLCRRDEFYENKRKEILSN